MFLQHVQLMRGRTPEKRLIHELRKAVAWYTKGLHASADLRDIHKMPTDPEALVASRAVLLGDGAQRTGSTHAAISGCF